MQNTCMSALKVIFGPKYKSYKNTVTKMNLEHLNEWRENLCLTFALINSRHPIMKNMFPLNKKTVGMSTRNPEKYKVQHALNERLRNSLIIYM